MSHQVIIIKSSAGGSGLVSDTDEVQITYTPPHEMEPNVIGKEVAKRLRWLKSLHHADAAED